MAIGPSNIRSSALSALVTMGMFLSRGPSYRVDSVVFDAEKLLMSNSCEIKMGNR